jgi:hypothetical protein
MSEKMEALRPYGGFILMAFERESGRKSSP